MIIQTPLATLSPLHQQITSPPIILLRLVLHGPARPKNMPPNPAMISLPWFLHPTGSYAFLMGTLTKLHHPISVPMSTFRIGCVQQAFLRLRSYMVGTTTSSCSKEDTRLLFT